MLWNLKDLIKDEKDFLQKLKQVEQAIPKYEQITKRLSNRMKEKEFKQAEIKLEGKSFGRNEN